MITIYFMTIYQLFCNFIWLSVASIQWASQQPRSLPTFVAEIMIIDERCWTCTAHPRPFFRFESNPFPMECDDQVNKWQPWDFCREFNCAYVCKLKMIPAKIDAPIIPKITKGKYFFLGINFLIIESTLYIRPLENSAKCKSIHNDCTPALTSMSHLHTSPI